MTQEINTAPLQITDTTGIATKEQSSNTAFAKAMSLLRNDGLLSITLPGEKYDVDKSNTGLLLQLLKSVGRMDLSAGRIYEGHINALFLIHLYGNEKQKQRWYEDARSGSLFGVWNTEAENGVTLYEKDENHFHLNGSKTFASGAGLVNRALITGRIENGNRKGWQMCIINTEHLSPDSIDYNSWHPMGMQSSLSYTIDFKGYCSTTDDLLGAPDVYYNQPYFGGGAIRFCAVQLGGAEALFNETMHYLKSLNRTEDVYQTTRLGEMAMEITSGNNWLEQAARYWDNWIGDDSKSGQLIAFINLARTAIERICLRVIELSAKCLGARGLMQPHRAESIMRDLQFYLRQPAPDAVLNSAAKYVIQCNRNIETIWNDSQTID